LHFDDEVLSWVQEALYSSHADKRREQEEAIARLRAEYDRLQRRLDAMYVDKLDRRVDAAFFDKMAAEWRAEQTRCQREIDRHLEADKSYMDEGVRILELARNAQRLFERQEPRQKRRLLNFVLSNCTWEDGEVVATLRQPFDLLAESSVVAVQAVRDGRRNLTKSEIWLPGPDSISRFKSLKLRAIKKTS
jgi:site-specific DNA recombinase